MQFTKLLLTHNFPGRSIPGDACPQSHPGKGTDGTRVFSEETVLELGDTHTGSYDLPPAASGPEAALVRSWGGKGKLRHHNLKGN